MRESNTRNMRRNAHYNEIELGGKQYKKPVESEDTQNRKKVQKFINETISSGYSDEHIIAFLSEKFPEYSPYLSSWIDNCRKKLKIENPENSEKDFDNLSL